MNTGINVTVECQVCGWCISYKNARTSRLRRHGFKNHVDEQHPPVGDGDVKVFSARG